MLKVRDEGFRGRIPSVETICQSSQNRQQIRVSSERQKRGIRRVCKSVRKLT